MTKCNMKYLMLMDSDNSEKPLQLLDNANIYY